MNSPQLETAMVELMGPALKEMEIETRSEESRHLETAMAELKGPALKELEIKTKMALGMAEDFVTFRAQQINGIHPDLAVAFSARHAEPGTLCLESFVDTSVLAMGNDIGAVMKHGFSVPKYGMIFPCGRAQLVRQRHSGDGEPQGSCCTFELLLCQVLVGRSFVVDLNSFDVEAAKLPPGFDSLCLLDFADPTSMAPDEVGSYYHQYLVYDSTCVLPTALVRFSLPQRVAEALMLSSTTPQDASRAPQGYDAGGPSHGVSRHPGGPSSGATTAMDRMVICDVCQERRAVLYCASDQARLCADCDAEAHSANVLVARHQRVPLHQSSAAGGVRGNTCSEHTGQAVEFFCPTCQVPVCVYCKMIGSHAQGSAGAHTLEPFVDAYLGMLDQVRQPSTAVLARLDELDGGIGQLAFAGERVSDAADAARREIEARYRAAIAQLELMTRFKMEVLLSEEIELRRQKAQLMHAQAFQKQIADVLPPMGVMESAPVSVALVQTLVDNPPPVRRSRWNANIRVSGEITVAADIPDAEDLPTPSRSVRPADLTAQMVDESLRLSEVGPWGDLIPNRDPERDPSLAGRGPTPGRHISFVDDAHPGDFRRTGTRKGRRKGKEKGKAPPTIGERAVSPAKPATPPKPAPPSPDPDQSSGGTASRRRRHKRRHSRTLPRGHRRFINLLLAEEADLGLTMGKSVPGQRLEEFARGALVLAHAEGCAVPMVSRAVEEEVEDAGTSSGALFSGASLASEMLTVVSEQLGVKYICDTLRGPVEALVEERGSFVVDPAKLSVRNATDLEGNQHRLRAYVSLFVDAIVASVDLVPLEFRQIAHAIYACVRDRWGQDRARVMVGSFIVVRCLCPAIVEPELFGVVEDAPSPEARAGLTMISHALEHMAHGVAFAPEDALAECLNGLCRQSYASLSEYLDEVCRADVSAVKPAPVMPPAPADQAQAVRCLATVFTEAFSSGWLRELAQEDRRVRKLQRLLEDELSQR